MIIRNATVFDGETFSETMDVRLEAGAVRESAPELSPGAGEEIIDFGGDYLLPGFVDVHIHAFRGSDTMHGEAEVRAMSRELATFGVAAFCPTTMSASVEDTRSAIAGIRAVMADPEPGGAKVLGAHMEAPFLCMAKAGAQRKEFFTLPDFDQLLLLTDGHPEAVRLITIAPELPGAERFIRQATEAGIHVSIGHTAADADTVHAAASWGADHVTHLFNAQTPLNHRAPGVPGAALTDDRLVCELICDGIHLHEDIIRLSSRAKGRKAIAITDAMEAAGMPEGVYQLGGQDVFVKNGAARLQDGTLAGSILTMPQALQNLIHRFSIAPALACAMTTSAPADSIGEKRCGRMLPGAPAPLTRWSKAWEMKEIIR